MNLSSIEQLRTNLRVFETVAAELHEKIEKYPVADRSALESELAIIQTHIKDLKRRLADAEPQGGQPGF